MKSWKNQWKAELNDATPKLRKDVANQPINVAAQASDGAPSQTPITRRKPFWYGLSSAVAAVLVFVLCVTLIPSGASDVYAFVVEINPAVTISADENGKVTGIVASNADADVILSDFSAVNALKGKPVDEAIEWYVDRAAQLGYLDEDNPSAVRITTADNGGKLLEAVSNKLESYFMNRGVKSIVITDVTDLQTLVARAGLTVKSSLKAIADYVQTSESVYRSRDVQALSVDELKQAYKNYATSDAFVNGVRDCLNGIIDLIEQNEKDIDELVDLNDRIQKHPDNRAIIKDYWSTKKFLEFLDMGQELPQLIAQMDEAVALYNNTYGDDINSSVDLTAASYKYSAVSSSDLRSALEHFSAAFLKLHVDWLSDILQTVSADSPLIELTALPETAEEFVSKMLNVIAIERDSREKQFEETYNKEREKITSADYQAFKQNLLSLYGSSDELWNNLK